jgi:hypothetical protein
MLLRISLCAFLCLTLSGCLITPEVEFSQKLEFDYVPPNVQPMSYNDLLCCEQCRA